jgi:glycosyltransferase involved in cell wall biosynthesis
VRNYAWQTRKHRIAMEVVCLDDPRSDYLAQETLPVHALGRPRGPWAFHPALRPWLENNLSRFDAVIMNGLWQYPGYALAQATQRPNRPPYFIFPHGMLDPWFQRAPGRRLKSIRNWFHWKLVERHVIQQARALFFTCAEEMRLAGNTFHPYRPQHQTNVGFGILPPPEYHAGMPAAFAEKCPGLKGRPYFLFLGRIDPKKSVDILVQAYAELSRSPGPLPKLVVAGPGLETPFGKKMQALAARTCPPGSVIWPGMITGDAKWGALHQAEAFVLMSHQENFGVAVVEALACATPVLISNQINIWREIEADQAGLVARDHLAGARQLLQAWLRLAPTEKQAMKSAARSSYEKHFRIEAATETLLGKIQALTGPAATRRQPAASGLLAPQ